MFSSNPDYKENKEVACRKSEYSEYIPLLDNHKSPRQRLYFDSYPKTCQEVFTSAADLEMGSTSKT